MMDRLREIDRKLEEIDKLSHVKHELSRLVGVCMKQEMRIQKLEEKLRDSQIDPEGYI